MELVESFGVILPTLRAAIKAIYKNRALNPATTQRCDFATPKIWATFYNLEVAIALVFRLNTHETNRIGKGCWIVCAKAKRVKAIIWVSV